jgi:hypothetical protein
LTSAIVGGEWSASGTVRFTPGKRAPDTHYIGVRVGPRAGLDDMEKNILTVPGLKLRPFSSQNTVIVIPLPHILDLVDENSVAKFKVYAALKAFKIWHETNITQYALFGD